MNMLYSMTMMYNLYNSLKLPFPGTANTRCTSGEPDITYIQLTKIMTKIDMILDVCLPHIMHVPLQFMIIHFKYMLLLF